MLSFLSALSLTLTVLCLLLPLFSLFHFLALSLFSLSFSLSFPLCVSTQQNTRDTHTQICIAYTLMYSHAYLRLDKHWLSSYAVSPVLVTAVFSGHLGISRRRCSNVSVLYSSERSLQQSLSSARASCSAGQLNKLDSRRRFFGMLSNTDLHFLAVLPHVVIV